MQYLTLNTAIRFPKMSSKFPYSRYRVLYTNALKSYRHFFLRNDFEYLIVFACQAAVYKNSSSLVTLGPHKKPNWS